jgi:hypothetical protein
MVQNEDMFNLQEIDIEDNSSPVPVATMKREKPGAGSEEEATPKKTKKLAIPRVKQEKTEACKKKSGSSKNPSSEATPPQDANASGCSSLPPQDGDPSGSGIPGAECSASLPEKKKSKRNPGLPPRPPTSSKKKKSDPQIKEPQAKTKNKKTVIITTPALKPSVPDAPADLEKLCEGMPPIYLKPVNWGIPVKKEEKKPPKLIPRPLQRELQTIVIDGEVFEPPKRIPEELVQVNFSFCDCVDVCKLSLSHPSYFRLSCMMMPLICPLICM